LTDLPRQLEEVVPSSESEALVDSGFNELGEGEYRKAFLNFQKAQEGQPSLPGIDYLVGYSALRAGEISLAKESLQHAITKNEMEADSKVLLALVSLDESGKQTAVSEKMTDPLVTAESELRHYASTHPMSAQVYRKWAEIQRQRGSYRTAADLYHKAFLRADPDDNLSLLAAKEVLTKLQNQPSKEAPSLATITAMSGMEALGAALACLQNKSPADAVLFLERAKEYYPPQIFREIMNDCAFDEYRSDAKISKFLESAFPKNLKS
jgi:tetratricopeptide (TPR) repeat protein